MMEVCGTHTMAIHRYGIKELLSKNIKLLSGPGCPVCVTSNYYIDMAIAYSRNDNVTLATFGDMMKVPGSTSSLLKEKGNGADVRVVYSTTDAVKIARQNPEKKIIFFGIGFETTTPTIAASILKAKELRLKNFFVVPASKILPPALEVLAKGKVKIDGFICPGHVSVVTGYNIYKPIVETYKIPCVIAGFEPLDILQAIELIAKQHINGKAKIENEYKRVVRPEGNRIAREMIDEVFEPTDSNWRGIGTIPDSGLKIRSRYSDFDAEKQIKVKVERTKENKACICGLVLKGVKEPTDCKLFRKVCTPETPVGACMVSSEGTCAAYYKYSGKLNE